MYLTKLTTYGMPLQTSPNNSAINKVAWQFYVPAWLSGYAIAGELMSCNVAYINDTTSLVPYGDRYNTSTGVEVAGIEAHPTLGAVFAILAANVPAAVSPAAAATGSNKPPSSESGGTTSSPGTSGSSTGARIVLKTRKKKPKPKTKRRRKKPSPKQHKGRTGPVKHHQKATRRKKR